MTASFRGNSLSERHPLEKCMLHVRVAVVEAVEVLERVAQSVGRRCRDIGVP